MKAINLAELSGSALFDALLVATRQGRKIRSAPKHTPSNPEEKEVKEIKNLPSKWETHSIVLLVHRHTCNTCEKDHTLPNARLLVHKSHPVLGDHFLAVSRAEVCYNYSHLPHRVKYTYSSSDHCERCFGLLEVMLRAITSPPMEGEQLNLPFGKKTPAEAECGIGQEC